MNKPAFSASDVLAIIGFGFGLLQVGQAINPQNSWVWIIAATVSMVVIVLGWQIYLLQKRLHLTFKIVHAKRDYEGDEFVSTIRNSEKQIRVIHTVPRPPGEKITNELLRCLDRGVEVIRIIPEGLKQTPEIAKWLEQFKGQQHYREHILRGNEFRMPFSFLIVDDKEVFAYFPDSVATDTTTEVLYFQNGEVANLFRNVFQKLYSQAQGHNHKCPCASAASEPAQ